jgi:hypothetical protein
MIKEVEFSNLLELINDGSVTYSDGNNQLMFESVLSDEAKTLTVTVGKALPTSSQGCRQLVLYYCVVDFETKMTDYVKLGETIYDMASSNPNEINKSYTFDLSKVLVIPQKVYSTGGTTDLTIRLYTYEANITTEYGDKTLSVPYSINTDSQYEYSQSTDGLYRLYMTDYNKWSAMTTYYAGDIVYLNGVLYMSLTDGQTNNNPITATTHWGAPSEADKIDFAYGLSPNQPRVSIISDMLVTRYAKYEYILKAIMATGYKSHDNHAAASVASLLQMFRERAIFQLLDHKPVDALHSLQQLKLAYSTVTDKTVVRTFNVKYTT